MTLYTSLSKEVFLDHLLIRGQIPKWLNGTLIRNGPAFFEIGAKKVHWVDGLAMLHAFSFQNGAVSYRNRFLRTDFYHAFKKGKLPFKTFISDPCHRLFRHFFTNFYQHAQNANVNVTKIADHYVALTEVPLSIEFDPKTLQTLGVFRFHDALEKGIRFETPHPQIDPEDNRSYNYYVKWSKSSTYNLYYIEDGQSERKLVSTIAIKRPAYMHTFATTKNFLILSEFPLRVNPFDLLLKAKPFIDNFKWDPSQGTTFHVIEKATGKVIKRQKGAPFFAFHHVNAFEEKENILIDLVAYEDPFFIWNDDLVFNAKKKLLRVILADGARYETLSETPFELPRINPRYNGRPYQYVYGVGKRGELIKDRHGLWHEEGAIAGEPVFIESPHSKNEDDGVILSVVLDQKQKKSFLLILDAKNFQEIGRAELPHHVPFGLHGQYYS